MESNSVELLAWLGCLVMGASGALAIWWVIRALETDALEQKQDEWRYDVSRINALRDADTMYRLFQTPIQFLAKLSRAAFRPMLPNVQREILAAGIPRYWLPEEYLARAQLISLLLLPFYIYCCVRYFGPAGVVTGLLLGGVTFWLLRRRLARLARQRLHEIKRRMPFLLDLLTLLMEAGSSFIQALRQSVKEFQGHSVAEEFGRVLGDMNMGKARTEAFDNLRTRLSDEEIGSIVGAIQQSEQLGSPLSDIFRSQADVLRVKRSQRAETIAGEAGVNMLLPAVLVMAATVLIILGPFVLNYIYFGWEL